MKNNREYNKRARACVADIIAQIRKARKAHEPSLFMPITDERAVYLPDAVRILARLGYHAERVEDWRGVYIFVRW